MTITVKVTPNASRNEVVGTQDGILRVRIQASPHDGQANKALIRILAKHFSAAPSRIAIIRGASSRTKIIDIQ